MSTTKQRTLKVVEHDDAKWLKWLAYEDKGSPAQVEVALIRGVRPQSSGTSLLKCSTDCRGEVCNNECDSSSAEVLAALGWDAGA